MEKFGLRKNKAAVQIWKMNKNRKDKEESKT